MTQLGIVDIARNTHYNGSTDNLKIGSVLDEVTTPLIVILPIKTSDIDGPGNHSLGVSNDTHVVEERPSSQEVVGI